MAILSWALDQVFGNHDNPYAGLKFDGSPYDRALAKALNVTNTIYDSKIAETQNRSAMAGSVAGVANQTRLSADTTANITSQRDEKVAGITAGYENQKANSEVAFNNQKQQLSAQWEQNRPGFFDFLAADLNIAGAAFGGISAIAGANATGNMASKIGQLTGFGQQAISGINANYKAPPSQPPNSTTDVLNGNANVTASLTNTEQIQIPPLKLNQNKSMFRSNPMNFDFGFSKQKKNILNLPKITF